MRLSHTLRIINWSAAAIVLAVLFSGKEEYYAWIVVALLAAACLHFLIETVVLLKRASYPLRLSNLSEYKDHQPYQVKDIESALASDEMLEEVSIPVILSGSLTGVIVKKAPPFRRQPRRRMTRQGPGPAGSMCEISPAQP